MGEIPSFHQNSQSTSVPQEDQDKFKIWVNRRLHLTEDPERIKIIPEHLLIVRKEYNDVIQREYFVRHRRHLFRHRAEAMFRLENGLYYPLRVHQFGEIKQRLGIKFGYFPTLEQNTSQGSFFYGEPEIFFQSRDDSLWMKYDENGMINLVGGLRFILDDGFVFEGDALKEETIVGGTGKYTDVIYRVRPIDENRIIMMSRERAGITTDTVLIPAEIDSDRRDEMVRTLFPWLNSEDPFLVDPNADISWRTADLLQLWGVDWRK